MQLNKVLEKIRAALGSDYDHMENLMKTIYNEKRDIKILGDVVKYLEGLRGKGIRSLVTMCFAKIADFNHEDVSIYRYQSCRMPKHYLAVAIELMHLATLLHDDVIDNGFIRRGIQTINKKWGNDVAILIGDYMFGRAFELIINSECMDAMKLLAETIATISSGELWQLTLLWDLTVSQETYFQLIHAKTGELFSAAARCGAISSIYARKIREMKSESEDENLENHNKSTLRPDNCLYNKPCTENDIIGDIEKNIEETKEANLIKLDEKNIQKKYMTDEEYIANAGKFGNLFGRIFQMYDDLIDYYSLEDEIGKDVGGDIMEGKITLPLIEIIQKINNVEYVALSGLIGEIRVFNYNNKAFMRFMYDMMKKYKTQFDIIKILEMYNNECIDILKRFPESTFRELLIELTNAVMSDARAILPT